MPILAVNNDQCMLVVGGIEQLFSNSAVSEVPATSPLLYPTLSTRHLVHKHIGTQVM